MKAKTLLITAAALAAGVMTSRAQVYSQNIVGYANVSFSGPNQYTLVANPLDSGTNTIGGVIGTTLPVNGKVLKWNGSSFNIYTRTTIGNGWLPNTAPTVTLNPGEGFFVYTPTAYTNTFVGSVLVGSQTNSYSALYTLSGNLIPTAGSITSLGMTNVPNNDKILTWNTGSQSYTIYTKTTIGAGWLPSVPSLGVGQGFFVNVPANGGPFDWVQTLNP